MVSGAPRRRRRRPRPATSSRMADRAEGVARPVGAGHDARRRGHDQDDAAHDHDGRAQRRGLHPPRQHHQRADGHAVERHERRRERQSGGVADHRHQLARRPRPSEEQLARFAERLLERDRRGHHHQRPRAGQTPGAEQRNRHQDEFARRAGGAHHRRDPAGPGRRRLERLGDRDIARQVRNEARLQADEHRHRGGGEHERARRGGGGHRDGIILDSWPTRTGRAPRGRAAC